MKGKPPFILYSNLNKPQSSHISNKYKNNKMRILYSRIPDKVIKETPVIEKLVHPEPKVYYNVISKFKKPKMIKLDKKMEEEQQKKLSNLNEFREMFYNFNKEEKEQMGNYFDIQAENNRFLHNYKKVQKDKNKFQTGTYLDHQYLIGIASNYSSRGIKIPKISVDKNVFASNPLILGGSDLEHYFLYNLGDKKKSNIFLRKVDEIVKRKLAGNYNLSDDEIKRLEHLKKKEKPKGYIVPSILIPKLKNDINQTKFTYENLEDFDKFFEEMGKKDKNIYKKILIQKMGNSRSCNNIFGDIYKSSSNTTSNRLDKNKDNKIIIKKNLSFINNIKSNMNKNKYSSLSTNAYVGSQVFSSSNSQRIMSNKDISKTNVSSAVSREKIYNSNSPIISPFNHWNYNDINSDKSRNNPNDFFILSKPLEYPEKNIYNILYDHVEKAGKYNSNSYLNKINGMSNNKKILKKKLVIRQNSACSIFGRRQSFLKNDIPKNDNIDIILSKRENQETDNNDIILSKREIQESEENELSLLNKELEGKGDNKSSKEVNKITNDDEKRNSINTNINLNINLNINNNINNIVNNQKLKKIKFGEDFSNINNENNIKTVEPQLVRNENSYRKIEKVFESILGNGYNSRRSKSEINDFLKSRGYNISKKVTSKDCYINVNRMKTKAIERNFLLEEFKIRNGENSKTPLTSKQQAIIDRNEFYTKQIERNEYILQKLLCEKNIEKETTDY